MKKVLITGIAGFIGYHLAERLLQEGYDITGIDNLSPYYDPALKTARLHALGVTNILENVPNPGKKGLDFRKTDLTDRAGITALFAEKKFDMVIHLAAQAGVRYSIDDPYTYVEANITGFLHILENCRNEGIRQIFAASTSSVYGLNEQVPSEENHPTETPANMYAVTKKTNELMAQVYSRLFGLHITMLRFFTVYGPWGRPDMALFIFTRHILEGKPLPVFNHGEMRRDFTYIGDIIEGMSRLLALPLHTEPSCEIYNIGHGNPVNLMDFIHAIERHTGKTALIEALPMQDGDIPLNFAATQKLFEKTGYLPGTTIDEGVKKFIDWYRSYYAT